MSLDPYDFANMLGIEHHDECGVRTVRIGDWFWFFHDRYESELCLELFRLRFHINEVAAHYADRGVEFSLHLWRGWAFRLSLRRYIKTL